jgi:ABC-type uncharacterized transport system auxiliary subunit
MKKLFVVVLLTFVLSGCFGLYSNNSITSLGNMSNTQLQHEYAALAFIQTTALHLWAI